METKVMTPATKGLMISLVIIVISVAITATKQESNRTLSIIPIAFVLGGVIWADLSYSKQMDGNVTFGNLFSHGFKSGAVVAAIASLWAALSLSILFPDALDRALDAQRLKMIKDGMDEDQIDKALTIGRKLAVPMGTVFTAILYLILGAIGSLVGAAISKKTETPVFPDKLG
jgi:hypothetical protein